MDDPLGQPEMARRIRAALAYAGPTFRIAEAAKATNVSIGDFPRYSSSKAKANYTFNPTQLRALATAIGIDPNFFTADFDRLDEIVPPGGVVFKRLDAPRPPAPPGELRQLPEDPEPSGGTGGHEESSSEGDSP